MISSDSNITKEIDTCSQNQKAETSLLFAINLPVIRHFYDTINLTLNGADQFLAHQIQHLAPLQWSVFSKNIYRILASDTENSHSLARIADSIHNGSDVIIHNPAEAVLYKFIQQRMVEDKFWRFDINSCMKWITLILVVTVVFGGIIIYRLIHKITILMAMMACPPLIPSVMGDTVDEFITRIIQRLTMHQPSTQTTTFGLSLTHIMANEIRYVDRRRDS